MLLFFGMRSSGPGERLLRPRSLSDLYSTPADIKEQLASAFLHILRSFEEEGCLIKLLL